MNDILKPDLCVIGGGSAGLTVAAAARAFGASVVLIEKGAMGGDCLNTGCVPSKALIAAAHHAHAGRQAAAFGVSFEAPRINFGRVNEHVQGVIAEIAPHDSVERYEALGAVVIEAPARFVDKRSVEAGGRTIRARRFVIAAGSHAAVAPIPGIESVPYLTNETIFTLTRKPQHLIIVGGGPIGMELAQAHVRLGCEVTVVEMQTPLGKDDPELTAFALRALARDGVRILADTQVEGVEPKGQGIAVRIKRAGESEVLSGSHLLLATGRVPNIEGLGLDAAGIQSDRRGIAVNSALRTSNRRVYAIGDIVAGGLQFTHVASYHASLVVRSALFGLPAREKRTIIPWATYTDPEIANVGLNEAAARAAHGEKFRILRWSFADNDRARTERQAEGLIKLITDRRGRILGCGIAGPHAGELISLFAYAVANGMKVGSLLKFIPPYPTLAEVARRVGVEYYREQLENPWVGRWLSFIRRLP